MDTMRICGNCLYYSMHPVNGPWCAKMRREVSYLQTAFDCFTEPGSVAEEIQTKVCSKCGRELPITNFGRHSRTKDGYQPCCRECQSEMNKGHRKRQPFEHNEAPAKPERPEAIPEGMKRCSHCGEILPVSEFNKHGRAKDGLQAACKTCQVKMTTKAKQKRAAKKKVLREEVQKEAMMKKVLAGMPAATSKPAIVNDLFDEVPKLITLQGATDEQLVRELQNRGYTGNIIRKTSYIL